MNRRRTKLIDRTVANLRPKVSLRPKLKGPLARPTMATGAIAVGSFALGAFAVGAVAIGRLAVGRLILGDGKIKRLHIEELEVDRLLVHSQNGGTIATGSGTAELPAPSAEFVPAHA
jgi:hypothetical protein